MAPAVYGEKLGWTHREGQVAVKGRGGHIGQDQRQPLAVPAAGPQVYHTALCRSKKAAIILMSHWTMWVKQHYFSETRERIGRWRGAYGGYHHQQDRESQGRGAADAATLGGKSLMLAG